STERGVLPQRMKADRATIPVCIAASVDGFEVQCIQFGGFLKKPKPRHPGFSAAEGRPMPVMRTNSMTFDASVPVLVVGGGGTGMTAALAAADAGAEVMVLERDATPTGTTSMAQGFICAAATKAQREKGVQDSPDAMFADIMKKTRGETDQTLA